MAASLSTDGRELRYQKTHYYMMNTPAGVVSATEDSREQTVLDLLPPELRGLGLFPVGRLDKDTQGLLILTDDGDFAHRVMSPKSGVWKRYYAEVDGVPDEADAAAFREGLVLGDGTRCLPARLECSGGSGCVVTVQEGKYHQVKRMLASRGKPVRTLRRLSVGALELDETLGPGGFRELDQQELCTVFLDRKPKTQA
jgi:16S rRNA pseudouridine516 synthase